MLHIRIVTEADITELKDLFRETVLHINIQDYTLEEIEDWASCGNTDEHWKDLIDKFHFFVAENEMEQIVGFASISNEGYLHSMFVHKDYQNMGIASKLYEKIEQFARENKIYRISSEVSITAKPFFQRQGFGIEKEQNSQAKNLFLTNYLMYKEIEQ